jgi:PIN domain
MQDTAPIAAAPVVTDRAEDLTCVPTEPKMLDFWRECQPIKPPSGPEGPMLTAKAMLMMAACDGEAPRVVAGHSVWSEGPWCRLWEQDYGIHPVFRTNHEQDRIAHDRCNIRPVTGKGQIICARPQAAGRGIQLAPPAGLQAGHSSREEDFRVRGQRPDDAPTACGKVSMPMREDWSQLTYYPDYPDGVPDRYVMRQALADATQWDGVDRKLSQDRSEARLGGGVGQRVHPDRCGRDTTTMPKTWTRAPGAVEDLRSLAVDLPTQLDAVIAQARIERRFEEDPASPVRIVTWDLWKWGFPADATPARRAAGRLLDRWVELARRLLAAAAPETVADFDEHVSVLQAPVDLSSSADGPGAADSAVATARVQAGLAAQLELLEGVLGTDAGEALWLVPDTNALLTNPALEEWEGDLPATIVIVPQVMRELDRHKLHHPKPELQEKARKLIRLFEEYSRRGDTLEEAVPVTGKLTYRDVVIDADMRTTLPWLRPDNADDQILASVLELRWHHPHRSITLVTEDQVLRNKARRARVSTDRAPKPGRAQEGVRPGRGRQRPIVKVKNAWVEQRWPPGRARSMPPLNILVIELVNIGERSAVDATGTAYFHPHSNDTRMTLQTFQMPALEAGGTWHLEHTLSLPPAGIVNAQSASIEGTCHDIEGNECPLG